MTNEGTPHKRRYTAAHSYQSTASAWRDDSRARAFAAMTEVEWCLYVARFGLAGVPAQFRRLAAVEDAMEMVLAEDENEVWAGRAPEPLVLPGCRASENISALRAESVQIGVLPPRAGKAVGVSTNIEWTRGDDGAAGMTWNPLAGCSMVSPGCANCYAETMANRLAGMAKKDIANGRDPGKKRAYLNVINEKGRWNAKVELIEPALVEPLSWKKPRRVFVNSMTDLFQEGVPFDFVDRVFAVMALCAQHTFQILTKRPERMAEYSNHFARAGSIWQAAIEYGHSGALNTEPEIWPLPNVWLGASVEDQARADERVPHLLRCPAAVRFLSCEPLLGAIDLREVPYDPSGDDLSDCIGAQLRNHVTGNGIDWVIVGGESGHGARPFDVLWAESIIDQCNAASVACFVKQLGARPFAGFCTCGGTGKVNCYICGGYYRLKDKKGGDPSEWPEDLRVREFPRPAEVSKC